MGSHHGSPSPGMVKLRESAHLCEPWEASVSLGDPSN